MTEQAPSRRNEIGRLEELQFESFAEVLDFAIAQEEEAARFYMSLAPKMEKARLRGLFLNFGREEERHKVKLMQIRHIEGESAIDGRKSREIDELHLARFVPEIEVSPDMGVNDALLLAMNEEKSAFRLYNSLKESAVCTGHREIFDFLASEEAKHKLYFEMAYEEILWENL